MGSTGAYLVFGILTLIMVPIVMAGIGNAFGQTIDVTNPESSRDNTLLSKLATYSNSLSNIYLIGGFFGFLSSMFNGYNLFPLWINVILFTVPVILIIRGAASTSG
jgi:uncharacterized membrane protein YhdT